MTYGLAEKGIDKGILARYSQKPSGVEMPTEAELARDLSKGKLAMACKLAFMMRSVILFIGIIITMKTNSFWILKQAKLSDVVQCQKMN